jgi:hypothetical protein
MGLTAAVEREIAEHMLPVLRCLRPFAEGQERAALAARYRRLEKALRADLTQGKTSAKRLPSRRKRVPGDEEHKAPN